MTGDLLPFLKLAPLVFTTGLRLLKQNFYSRWADVVKEFGDENTSRGDFEQYTVFAFDWFESKYGLASTFLYTGILAVYTSQLSSTAQSRSEILVVIGVILLGLAVGVVFIVDRWFNRKNNRPESYYRFFYREGGFFNEPADDRMIELVEDQYRSKYLSPSNVTLVSDTLLILLSIWIVFG